jgi:outer membrane protein
MHVSLTGKAAITALSIYAAVTGASIAHAGSVVPSDWTITLGAEGRVLPEYEGSGGSLLRPVPILRVRRAGTVERFRSPRDGASIGLFDTGRFMVGPTAKFKLPRKESVSNDLRGLGDVDWTLEIGGFAEFWPLEWLRTRAELRQGIGGHRGLVADVMADVVVPVAPRLTLSGGPRLTLTSAKAESPYFSVTPSQSAASGLPVYDAGGGVHSYGVGAQARYTWTPQWATHFFMEYERLAGDAANSPLVTQRGSRDQIQVGIGATYSFDIRGLW